jgi:hypothetical protein
MANLTLVELTDNLSTCLTAIERLDGMTPDGRHRVERQSLDRVICDARKALDVGKPAAVRAALNSIDLLLFELCDD